MHGDLFSQSAVVSYTRFGFATSQYQTSQNILNRSTKSTTNTNNSSLR